jgi:hypothetical protein
MHFRLVGYSRVREALRWGRRACTVYCCMWVNSPLPGPFPQERRAFLAKGERKSGHCIVMVVQSPKVPLSCVCGIAKCLMIYLTSLRLKNGSRGSTGGWGGGSPQCLDHLVNSGGG